MRREDGLDLEALYERYGALVLRRVRRFYGPAEAADVVQAVFARAIEEAGALDDVASVGEWLYELTTRHCLDCLSRRDAPEEPRPGHLADLTLELAAAGEPDACAAVRAHGRTCAACRARRYALVDGEALPPLKIAALPRPRLAPKRPPPWRELAIVAGWAVGAVGWCAVAWVLSA